MIEKKKRKFKNIEIFPSKSHLKNKEIIKGKEISELTNKNKQKKLNSKDSNNEIENLEYGFEIDQSNDSNSNYINKNENNKNNNDIIILSSLNENSNGDNKDNLELLDINYKTDKKNKNFINEFISNPAKDSIINKNSKINERKRSNNELNKDANNNDINNLFSMISSNNNVINDNKINYIEDNDWNNPKLNFDSISVVSKVNSCENNFNEHSNIVDYNNDEQNILLKSENIKTIFINKENQDIKEVSLSQEISKKLSSNLNNNKYVKNSFRSNISKNSSAEENNINEKEKNDDLNIINELNKEKKSLEEKLQKEIISNKQKNNYIDILKKSLNNKIIQNKNMYLNNSLDKCAKQLNINSFDLIIDYTKYKLENEKIKKNIIMQKVLCDDMREELQNYKNEKDKLNQELSKYKSSSGKIKQKINEYEIKLNEKKSIEDELKLNLNKQKQICLNLKKEINKLKQKNDDLIKLNEKINKDKCVVTIEEKGLEDYKRILNEKNSIIQELSNENLILVKEMEIKDKNLKNNEENKLIDDTCTNIKDVLKYMEDYHKQIRESNSNDNYMFLVKIIKDFIDNINTDNNGNISLNEKLKFIYKFSDIIKMKIHLLFDNFIKDNNLNFNKEKNLKENQNNNNLLASQNGQNVINNNIINSNLNNNKDNKIRSYNKKYISNDIFKKLDTNKYHKDFGINNINNHTSENHWFYKYNNKYQIDNLTGRKNNTNLYHNNTFNLRNNLLEKNSIIFKSNISPLNKRNIISTSNNKRINMNYDDLVESIFNNDLKDNKNQKNNTKLNLKVEELKGLINNTKLNTNPKLSLNCTKNNGNLYNLKNIKKSKKFLNEFTDDKNDTTSVSKVFPSNQNLNNFASFTSSISSGRRNSNNNEKSSDFIFKKTKKYNEPIITNYFSGNKRPNFNTSANLWSNNKTKYENFDLNKNKSNISSNFVNKSNDLFDSKVLKSIKLNKNESSSININSTLNSVEIIRTRNVKNNNLKKVSYKNLLNHENNNTNISNAHDINGLSNEITKPNFKK